MTHIDSCHKKFAIGALGLLLALLVLAACGGSSKKTSSSTTHGPTHAEEQATREKLIRKVAEIRLCLVKDGINVDRGRPAGMSAQQFQTDEEKCGVPGASKTLRRGNPRLKTPAGRRALDAFAACVRAQGQDLPNPREAPTGPIFDTKGLDLNGAAFKKAAAKCQPALTKALRARGG